MSASRPARTNRRFQVAAAIPLAAIGLAACGSGSSGGSTSLSSGSTAMSSPTASASQSPSTSFHAANVAGLGRVVVDGRGHTVYILTTPGTKNVSCTDGNGCTAIWPDLPLPDGVSSAKAGMGLQSSLMGSKKESDGETYPTYNGYLMYEYAADTGPGDAKGQGIKSFGGTWWVLSPSGKPITTPSSTGSNGSSSTSGGGYSSGY